MGGNEQNERARQEQIEFQALFCWIDGGNRPAWSPAPFLFHVSSLVLLDRWGGTHKSSSPRFAGSRFQALFCWIDGGEHDPTESHRPTRSRFQALFCWIDGGGTLWHSKTTPCDHLFQALFCWIDGGELIAEKPEGWGEEVSSLVLLDRWGGTPLRA